MFIRGIQNSRNFHPSRSERLACFETQTSSEDFLEFSGTSCTLYFKKIAFSNRILCICKYFILDERFIHFRSWHFEIGLSALIWDLCWIIFAMCSADFNSVNGSTSQVCITLACVASVSVWFRSNERPRNGILGFGRARNETRANKWRGGGGGKEEESGFLPFFPTLSSLFYLRHFSRGPGLSFLGRCSQTAPKRLLRRLERAHYWNHTVKGHVTDAAVMGRKQSEAWSKWKILAYLVWAGAPNLREIMGSQVTCTCIT